MGHMENKKCLKCFEIYRQYLAGTLFNCNSKLLFVIRISFTPEMLSQIQSYLKNSELDER
uniref:Uncharacterized protein n=1 Tax=Setaria italica TaxID=4555 RepID=K3ZPV0_SETIT